VGRLELEAATMKTLLAWMLLCFAALAQQPFPGVPPGWTIYVVHAPWCAPCQRFRGDYDSISEFRSRLESAFAVKSVEWEKPSEQRFARRFAIASLPGFIVFRDGIHQQSFSGYSGDWRAFLERLNLDADGARIGTEENGTPPQSSRPVTPTERALPEITDLRLEIDRLREQLRKQASGSSLLPETPAADENRQQAGTSPLPPVLSIPPVDTPGGSGAGIGADWAKVGAAALALFAPQVAIPAGAIGVAGTVFQLLRKRRLAMQQQPPQRQTVIERPVPVAMPAMPQPAQVVTQNQYVPIDTDSTADAYTWATAQLVKQYPGAEGTVAMLASLVEQHKAAQSGGRNSGHK
jgi:hypothetical protein